MSPICTVATPQPCDQVAITAIIMLSDEGAPVYTALRCATHPAKDWIPVIRHTSPAQEFVVAKLPRIPVA